MFEAATLRPGLLPPPSCFGLSFAFPADSTCGLFAARQKTEGPVCACGVCVCGVCVCVRVNHVYFLGCLKSGVTHSFPRVEDLSQLCYHNSNLTLKFVKLGKEIKPSHLTA